MQLFSLFQVSTQDKHRVTKQITDAGLLNQNFIIMLLGSVGLATCAILLDSIPVLIASMLVAPVLFPILGIALGVVTRDTRMLGNSSKVFGKSVIYALILAIGITVLFGRQGVHTRSLVLFSSDLFLSTVVAAISGFIAVYGLVRPALSAALSGVAIAVSLIPPLAAVGVGLASFDWLLARDAAGIFVVNIIGIIVIAIITFSLFNFSKTRLHLKNEESPIE